MVLVEFEEMTLSDSITDASSHHSDALTDDQCDCKLALPFAVPPAGRTDGRTDERTSTSRMSCVRCSTEAAFSVARLKATV